MARNDSNRTIDLSNAVLIDLDVSLPMGARRGSAEDLGLKVGEAPPEVFSIVKRFLPRDWLAEHNTLVGRAVRLLETHASPVVFPIGKARLIVPASVPEVAERLTALQRAFDEATEVKVGAAAYARMRREVLEQHPRFREALEVCFPPAMEMRRRFRFSWQLFEIALPKGARLKAAKVAKVAAYQRVLELERLKAQRAVGEFFTEHNRAILAEVQGVCARVAERIADGEPVSERTLAGVASKLEWFERMASLGGDGTVAASVKSLVAGLKRQALTTAAYNVQQDRATAASFQGALQRAAEACSKAASDLQPGRHVRRLWSARQEDE